MLPTLLHTMLGTQTLGNTLLLIWAIDRSHLPQQRLDQMPTYLLKSTANVNQPTLPHQALQHLLQIFHSNPQIL